MWGFFKKSKQARNCSAYKLIQPLKESTDGSAHNLENKTKQICWKKRINWHCFYSWWYNLGSSALILVLGQGIWNRIFWFCFLSHSLIIRLACLYCKLLFGQQASLCKGCLWCIELCSTTRRWFRLMLLLYRRPWFKIKTRWN